MTTGHRHRVVSVKRNGVIHRVLTVTLLSTTNLEWVDRSHLVFGPHKCFRRNCYVLRPLGILHGLFGLTLSIREKKQ